MIDRLVAVLYEVNERNQKVLSLQLGKRNYTMSLIIEERDLEKFIMVGDRVLVKPKNPTGKTKSPVFRTLI